MKGKLLFVVGIAAGYVIGARAGRTAYEGIVDRVEQAVADPRVHDVVEKAAGKVEQATPAVVGAMRTATGAASGAVTAAKEASGDGAASDPAPAAVPAPASAPATGAVPGGADESRTPTASD